MIFSTYKFILGFLPIVFAAYWILTKAKFFTLAKLVLVVASLYFYMQGSAEFFPYFCISIFGNYVVGNSLCALKGDDKKIAIQKKVILLFGILGNIALLGYYKYDNFILRNINSIFGTDFQMRNTPLPIGISFFTFQLIAFLADSYKDSSKEYTILNYLLFITFFPQLIVGPIVHHSEIVPQFESEEKKKFNAENIKCGIILFVAGCAKKLILADPLTQSAQTFFDALTSENVPGFLESWFYSIEYTISYYFDLSGYADMAIGLGLMFNIILPENFNSPYKARNFQDYWRRWHITLSRFLGDYVFKSVFRKESKIRNYYVATLITFLVSGFWHGAGWRFVLWGMLNGIFVCAASFMKRKNLSLPAPLAYTLTALGVVALRALFVLNSLRSGFSIFIGMTNLKNFFSQNFFQQIMEFGNKKLLFAAILICWLAPTSKLVTEKIKTKKISAVAAGTLFAVCILLMNNTVSDFLYFQF